MKALTAVGLGLVVSLGACQSLPTPEADTALVQDLDRQLEDIARLMSGDYFSDAEGGAREGRPIYMRLRNITPPLGKRHAMYAEMRHDGPDGDFYRQLIYLFDESTERGENRMQAYRVADEEMAARLIDDPNAFAEGHVEITSSLSEDCYAVLSSTEAGYTSWIDPERCIITGKRGDQRRIESRTDITQDAIAQLERGYSLEWDLLFGNATGEQYIWPRVSSRDAD